MKNRNKIIALGAMIATLLLIFLLIRNDIKPSEKNSQNQSSSIKEAESSPSDDNSSSSKSDESKQNKTINVTEYKTGISYEELSGYKYIASKVTFPAKVIEVSDNLSALVVMGNNQDDKIMVNTPADNMYENTLHKGDIVTVYGMNTAKQDFSTDGFGKIKIPVLICDKVNFGVDKNVSQFYSEGSASKAQDSSSSIPTDYLSALAQADRYANHMNMSKDALYDQLTSKYGSKFSNEAAQYAVDNVEADWSKNALESAKKYQKMNMSTEDIRDQLTSSYGGKFTQEQADYAVANLSK